MLPTKEELFNYYVTLNSSRSDTLKFFNIRSRDFQKALRLYDISKPRSLSDKLRSASKLPEGTKFFLTLSEEDLRELYKNYSGVEIAKKYNVCINVVYERFKDFNIEKELPQDMIKKEDIDLYYIQQNMSKDEFIKKFGINRHAFDLALRFYDIKKTKKQRAQALENFFSEKYGKEITNPSQLKSVVDKREITNLNRRGYKTPFEDPEVQKKIEKTNIERYGNKNPAKNKEIGKKISLKARDAKVIEKSWLTKIKNNTTSFSKPEKEILNFIKSIFSGEVKPNYRGIITPLELDIVIPDLKIAIEHNGLYHHSEAQKSDDYHFKKTASCKEKGYRLIHIFGHEWQEREMAVKSRLMAILGIAEYKIGARQTELVKVQKNDKEVKDFLSEYHVQGSANFSIGYKLVFQDKIVCVMTFNKHHRQNCSQMVLNRFCVRNNYLVMGGASKLFKIAKKDIKETIVSYSDNRWSDGNLYLKLGFTLDRENPPDYFYFHNNRQTVHSKQSLKKTQQERLTNKTEHELRLEQGYLRVYDCGKKKWIHTS